MPEPEAAILPPPNSQDVDPEKLHSGENESTEGELEEIDEVAEKKLLNKLDSRILPITCLLYFVACEYSIASHPFLLLIIRRMNLDRPRPLKFGQCAIARAPAGYFAWRREWKTIRLGQLGVLFLICKSSAITTSFDTNEGPIHRSYAKSPHASTPSSFPHASIWHSTPLAGGSAPH